MQERSSHKAILQPQEHKEQSAPQKMSYWFPGDETHAPIYIDAYSEDEAKKLYEQYLAR